MTRIYTLVWEGKQELRFACAKGAVVPTSKEKFPWTEVPGDNINVHTFVCSLQELKQQQYIAREPRQSGRREVIFI
jgi:hypothetical protein